MQGLNTKLTQEEQELGWAIRRGADLVWEPDNISSDCVGLFQQNPFNKTVGDWLCYLPANSSVLLGLAGAIMADTQQELENLAKELKET
jgi:hypothetical protein